ncbi:XamI family restriction endonuclease, partial [Burkholderia cenocepacia]
VASRKVSVLSDAPAPGEFCAESDLGGRKADVLVGLWDRRVMPIECKVSNSSTNSVKRLNNDAAVKAETWRKDFGQLQMVPSAVLGGVYKLHNLQDAQRRGLSLFWAHDLNSLTNWISSTKR